MTRDPTYESLQLEPSAAKQEQRDQQDDNYSTPNVVTLTTTAVQSGDARNVKDISDVEGYTEPWTGEQHHFKPMHGEDNYTLPSRVRTKVNDGITAESVVLRGHHNLLPASFRSASVEDVSGTPVVSGPVRASMPPDSLLSHEIDHNISSSLTPSPSTLSQPPSKLNAGEELSCLPASDQSISKLQVTAPQLTIVLIASLSLSLSLPQSMLGAEFMQLTGGPRKERAEIQQQRGVLKGKRRVNIRLLNGNTLSLHVNPKCLCRDFFHHVVCLLDIKQWTSFGLSVRQGMSILPLTIINSR